MDQNKVLQRPLTGQPLYVGVFMLCIALMLLLPAPFPTMILAVLVVGSLRIAMSAPLHPEITLRIPSIPLRLQYTLEIAFILLAVWYFTPLLQDWRTDRLIRGRETTYLLNSGAVAAEVFHRSGSIPLWNPFIGTGEPLIENPFSFVLNPLMTLPIFAAGTIQGHKISVLLHIALMGTGGWMLAYTLGMRAPGRLLAGLLFAGNGSMAAAIGTGFYQMSLSQAYVPWVYAGLIGVLHPVGTQHAASPRPYIGLLAVSTMLLIFAGTFWYALPTMIVCGLLIIFAFVRRRGMARHTPTDMHRTAPLPSLWGKGLGDGGVLRPLLIAACFIIGLSAVRLLPQAAHHEYVLHPAASLLSEPFDLLEVIRRYVEPGEVSAMFYHYTLPLWFGGVLFITAILFIPGTSFSRWRIMIPACLGVILFTLWTQDGPVIKRIYEQIPLLGEWRYVGRMGAAAVPWIIILAALLFDNILCEMIRGASTNMLRAGAVLLFCAAGLVAAGNVLENWNRASGTDRVLDLNRPVLLHLREEHPNDFLSVENPGFGDYLPFWETLMRAHYGNPDYQAGSMPYTYGSRHTSQFLPEYGIGFEETTQRYLIQSGFIPDMYQHERFGSILFTNPYAPPYTFLIPEARFQTSYTPIRRKEVTPALSYSHGIDSITVHASPPSEPSLLVVTETAYPGWRVTVNGVPAEVESVGGLLGVRLGSNPGGAPLRITFQYVPTWLYIGGATTLLTIILLSLYLLRVDQRLRRIL